MKLTVEKSEQLAKVISAIHVLMLVNDFDLDYTREATKALHDKASRSAATLAITGADPLYVQLLNEQARAMSHLVNFAEAIEKCNELKKDLHNRIALNDELKRLFL